MAVSILADPSGGASVSIIPDEPVVDKTNLTSSGKYVDKASAKSDSHSGLSDKDQHKKRPVVESLGGGKYQIGVVVIDKSKRTVSIPARVNMTKGLVEYILVTNEGKTHEAVFTTEARPSDVHTACLLMGMKELPMQSWPSDYRSIALQNRVLVDIVWKGNGPDKKVPATQSIVRTGSGKNAESSPAYLEQGPWLYAGSCIEAGAFSADREGSLISVISDKAALVNGIRPNSHDDTLFEANGKLLPAKGFKVEFVLTLPSPR